MARQQLPVLTIFLGLAVINWSVPSDVVALPSSSLHKGQRVHGRSAWASRYQGQHINGSSLQPLASSRWSTCTEEVYKATKPCGFKYKGFSGFKHAEGTNYCLYFSDKSKSFYEFIKYCAKFDGGKNTYAFCPGDAKKQQAATSLMHNKKIPYWIGYNDQEKEGHWVCANDGKEIVWKPASPTNKSGQDCAYMAATDGQWGDGQCNARKRFICEHRLEQTKAPKARTGGPKNVELGKTLGISCLVRSEDEESTDGMYLMWRQHNRETKYQLNQAINTAEDVLRARKWHPVPTGTWPYPKFEKYNESVKYTYKTIPACERNLQHVYYFHNIWWSLHHAKWQCCFHSQQQCSEPFSIGIKVYPRKPALTIPWRGLPGKFYEGEEFLEATCTAYVGGIEPSKLTWVYTSQDKAYTWISQPGVRTEHLEPWVKIVKIPEQIECPDPTDLWDFNTGTCYRAKFSRYTQSQAVRHCEEIQSDEGFPWMLAKITPRMFEKILGSLTSLGGTNYWIGLNDKKTEGVYQWLDGTKTSSEKWKDRWHDQGSGQTDGDCAFLNTSGIYVNSPCNMTFGYICQSPKRYTVSKLDYNAANGPHYTSILKIRITKAASLRCYSYKGSDADVLQEIRRRRIQVSTAAYINYIGMPGEPRMYIRWPEKTPGVVYSGDEISATCTAHLGGEYPMIRWEIWSPTTGAHSVQHAPGSKPAYLGWLKIIEIQGKELGSGTGSSFTSFVKIKAKKSMQGGYLQCSSYFQGDPVILGEAIKRGVKLAKRTKNISFFFAVKKPIVKSKYGIVDGRKRLTMTCSTHVGDTHVMTWAVRLTDRSIHTWKIFTDGTIDYAGGLGDFEVTFKNASISEEEGNDIVAELSVDFSLRVHGIQVRCYPYDLSTGKSKHLKIDHWSSELKFEKTIRYFPKGFDFQFGKIVSQDEPPVDEGFETGLGKVLAWMLGIFFVAWCCAIIAIHWTAPKTSERADFLGDLADEMIVSN